MTDFNAMWLLVGLLVGCTAGIAGMIALLALGSAGRGKAKRRKTERRALAAWRGLANLLPGWRPTLDQLEALDNAPPPLLAAYRSIADGWTRDDARWDVLVGVLVHARREALRVRVDEIRQAAEQAPPVRIVREQHPAELVEQHPAEVLSSEGTDVIMS